MRELENAVERAVILADKGKPIEADLLGLQVMSGKSLKEPTEETESAKGEIQSMEEVERKHIENALAACNGNRTHAAEKLGLNVRTLRNKIKLYKLED